MTQATWSDVEQDAIRRANRVVRDPSGPLSPTTGKKIVGIALGEEPYASSASPTQIRAASNFDAVFTTVRVLLVSLLPSHTQTRVAETLGYEKLIAVAPGARALLVVDSPLTERFFRDPVQLLTTPEETFVVAADAIDALEAAERESSDAFEEDLDRERQVWKYSRR